MVFATSIPQFRAVIDVEGEISHTFLRQLDEIVGDIDRSVRGVARMQTAITRLGRFEQFRDLARYMRRLFNHKTKSIAYQVGVLHQVLVG